jgi:hypothetical protein
MGRALGTLLILGLGLAAGGQTINADTWRVRLADVADHKLLSATDNSGVIEFRNEKTVAFTVPSGSIMEILHSTQQIRRSTKAHRYFEKMCCGSTQSELLPVLVAAISAPFGHSRAHYVEVHCYFNGDHAVVLELGKNKYLPVLELASASQRDEMGGH